MRNEQDIFEDLADLCTTPGYAHAIAYLCFRDNMVGYAEEITADDMLPLYSKTRLIRTEISTLVGLMIKENVDYAMPVPSVLQEYIDKTESLLKELHHSILVPMIAELDSEKLIEQGSGPFTSGEVLREPIFYGGESAYSFQYPDFSLKKYSKDNEWFETSRGFSIRTAKVVVYAIQKTQSEKILTTLNALKKMPPDKWSLLTAYILASKEIAERTGIDKAVVERVLVAFSVPGREKNSDFCALNDFNVTNALPLLSTGKGSYILFQTYSLVEALYETPFYWMCDDAIYETMALKHRGQFTEEFSQERLELVFGKKNVYPNVDIIESKSRKLGEIDVLVFFGNRAIVLQAKSKRLSLEAKRGNDGRIRDDFKKSIQDSYDQGHKCALALIEGNYKLCNADSMEIPIPLDLKEVYIFCVVADHYPALSAQARQFLKYTTTDAIYPPFVMDVFTLDTMTEMLNTPLKFLSYMNRRTKYSDRLMASHELTILSYHLKHNLWIHDDHNLVVLDDTISVDLDIAMAVRRDGVPGKRTPEGILTRYGATTLGRFIEEIEARPDPATIDLGFMLLTLNEETVATISKGIKYISRQARDDRKSHDLTVGIGEGSTGLTIHCNGDPISIAGPRLQRHCEARKYTEKADSWFGVCIAPANASSRFGLNLDYSWEQSAEMDAKTRDLPRQSNIGGLSALGVREKKIGRNEPCPCGSGRKYKKCCLER